MLGLIALAAVGWVVYQALGPNNDPQQPLQVAVPNVVGFQEDVAIRDITERGLLHAEEREASDRPVGEVIDQDPGAGQQVAEGSTVTLVISSGLEALTIPHLADFEESAARTNLDGRGFLNVRAEATEENDPDFAEGRVIRTEPAAGEEVDPHQEIVLVVSTGQVEVPGVVDLEANEAISDLRDQTLRWEITYRETSEVDPNIVLEQSIAAGELVDQETVIALTVSKAPTVTVTSETTITPPPPPPSTTEPPTTTTTAPPSDSGTSTGGPGNRGGENPGGGGGGGGGTTPPTPTG